MSNMFNSLIRFSKSSGFFWKLSFFVGLITVPQYFYWYYGRDIKYNNYNYQFFDTDTFAIKHLSLFGWVLGGVLVGFGTRMSNGCTSGHLICGIPRRQARSFIAAVAYIGAAMGMASYRYNHPFMEKGNIFTQTIHDKMQWMSQGLAFFATIYFVVNLLKSIG